MKSIYITLMGRSGWAVVNSFHASIIETDYRPDEIFVIYENTYKESVKPVMKGLELIQETYREHNVQGKTVPDWDTIAAGNAALDIVNAAKDDGARVALDITGGRKALVAGSLLALKNSKIDHVYYLAIDNLEGAARPYPVIPKRHQRLFDIITNQVQRRDYSFSSNISETDILVSRECMMAVLNLEYSRDERISVRAPLLDLDLLDIDLQKSEIRVQTDRERYEEKLDASRDANIDYPSFGEFKRCLSYSGALEFENAAELEEIFTEFSKSYDPKSGIRRNFIALDANMFYNGVPSAISRLERRLGINPKDIMCVTPYPVYREVRKDIQHKYTRNGLGDARHFFKSTHQISLVEELEGQNKLKTRNAKMATAQLTNFMARPVHLRTDNVGLPKDKEEVDQVIADSLESFAKKNGVRVTLLSSDKNMLDICELAEDVGAKILRIPDSIPDTLFLSDETIVDMVISLSLLFGAIEISHVGLVLGEYRGKVSSKYTDEVKTRVFNQDRAKMLQERISICEKLMQIGIS